jgi:hypothetical protein
LINASQRCGIGPRPASARHDDDIEGDLITFPQPQASTAEYGIMAPADPDQIPAIDAWDTWKLTAVSADDESQLDALTDD